MGKWYKLDNAAKVFPSVTNTKNTSVFRISALLLDEVNAEILQQATDLILDRFPTMTVKLRRGIFWNYLDRNAERLLVSEETQYPCSGINPKENNGYLIKVLYYRHRVSVEVFHSLTDGSGAIEFLKSLLYFYLELSGKDVEPEDKILLPKSGVHITDVEDSFSKYYQKKRLTKDIKKDAKQEQAYPIRGRRFDNYGNNVTHGVVDVAKLNSAAKRRGLTITAYLISLLIYSIWQTDRKSRISGEPIIIAVPVNLRNPFPSQTLRNFFGVVNVGAKFEEGITFDELAHGVAADLKEKTDIENLRDLITNNMKLEHSAFTRFVPLFIKNIFINFGYDVLGESKKTMSLSNLGIVQLPEKMSKYIDRFETILYPSKKSPLSCCTNSENGKLTITFARTIIEADILRYFFSYLSKEEGLDVEIYSNDWGKYDG